MTDIAAPTTKAELLERLTRARERFDEALSRIPRERLLEPSWGEWTLKDLVAHVAAYERWTAEQMAAEPPEEERGQVEATASGGVDALNRMIYEQHRDDPLQQVLAESPAAHAALREAVERLTDDELARPQWWTDGRRSTR